MLNAASAFIRGNFKARAEVLQDLSRACLHGVVNVTVLGGGTFGVIKALHQYFPTIRNTGMIPGINTEIGALLIATAGLLTTTFIAAKVGAFMYSASAHQNHETPLKAVEINCFISTLFLRLTTANIDLTAPMVKSLVEKVCAQFPEAGICVSEATQAAIALLVKKGVLALSVTATTCMATAIGALLINERAERQAMARPQAM